LAREATAELSKRIGSLRSTALDVLREMTSWGFSSNGELSVAVAGLQRAANELAAVERTVRSLAPASPAGAGSALDRADRSPKTPAPSQDAAIVLELAGTTLPFATSFEDEAERWLRVLRLHGRVASAMKAIGIAERPLGTIAQPNHSGAEPRRSGETAVGMVASRAAHLARERDAATIGTLEVLFAVMEIYRGAFDRALYVRGASREQLLANLPRTVDAFAVL
jgi:hypothetical protein